MRLQRVFHLAKEFIVLRVTEENSYFRNVSQQVQSEVVDCNNLALSMLLVMLKDSEFRPKVTGFYFRFYPKSLISVQHLKKMNDDI